MIISKDMYINQETYPDIKSREYKAFWQKERDKCMEGISIDGYFFSGFLYFYLNFWKINIDEVSEKMNRSIRTLHSPYLRDNEYIIDKYIQQGLRERKGVCILGSRRLGKSEIESAWIAYNTTFFKGTENVIASTSDYDLDVLKKKIDLGMNHLPNAFKHPRIETDWKKGITFGKKDREGNRDVFSNIMIRNLDAGNNTEVLAGLSPFSLVIDEIGKTKFLEALMAAAPGFATPDGWRCSPLLFGTGGSFEDGQDAEALFSSPDEYNFICMQLPEEANRTTAIFIPGHYAHDFPKKKISMAEYLGADDEEHSNLQKLEIQATDFDLAERMIDTEREKASRANDSKALLKLTMYHPKNSYEVFLTDSRNNFPVEAIKPHKAWLEDYYEPYCVELFRDEKNVVKSRISDKKPINKFPVKRDDIKEAPVVIYEPPIEGLQFGTYCIGIDPYNEDNSSEKLNSLGSIYVMKRMYNPLGEFQFSIVASYAGRCKYVKDFHQLCLDITEYYNGIALPENSDKSIIQFFDFKRKPYLLADSLELAQVINPLTKSGRTKGLSPSTPNQRYYMNLMLEYTKEEIYTVNQEGEEIIRMGLTRILDSMLLTEMENYRGKKSSSNGIHDGNYDRIIGFGHALTLARYYDVKYPITEYKDPIKLKEEQDKPKKQIIHSPFTGVMVKKNNNPFNPISTNRKGPRGPFLGIK